MYNDLRMVIKTKDEPNHTLSILSLSEDYLKKLCHVKNFSNVLTNENSNDLCFSINDGS